MGHEAQLVTYSALTIVGIVVLIMKLRIDPVIALVVGSITLGLLGGLSVDDAINATLTGFGNLMAEIGLLIAFGVLLGALLSYMGAIEKLVDLLMRTFGPRSMPYSFGLAVGILLPAIFVDVMLVISAPIVRALAPKIGKHGIARMATALAIGLECGLTMMIPGVAALALSGLLNVPLGTMLLCGGAVAAATIPTSIFIMSILFRLGFWNPDKDEKPFVELDPLATTDSDGGEPSAAGTPTSGSLPADVKTTAPASETTVVVKQPPLLLSLAPLLGALVLVAAGAIASASDWENPTVQLLTNPTVAIMLGLISAGLLSRAYFGRSATEGAMSKGFRDAGQILALTGVGGCLAQVVQEIGLGEVVERHFSANAAAPLLLVWLVGAALHMAISSVTTASITAAGLLAPIASSLDINPVLIALAAGSGAMFVIHVTSNTFWMMQALLGQTTRGTLKTCSFGVSVASVIGLGYTLVLSIFI